MPERGRKRKADNPGADAAAQAEAQATKVLQKKQLKKVAADHENRKQLEVLTGAILCDHDPAKFADV
jgi:hypothetical protein|eukprot:COSAG01_NODE_5075_length_4505_cov_5.572174_4_plen_67_part_00